jgi:hypothetical protein
MRRFAIPPQGNHHLSLRVLEVTKSGSPDDREGPTFPAVLHALSLMKFSILLLPVALLLAGCSSLSTHVEPKTNLGQLKHIYVVENLNDNHNLHRLIAQELQARGIQAESGPLTLIPPGTKTYLVYDDHWDWDFKDYLIGLSITLRETSSDHPLANAFYFRPTAFLKSPRFMVQTVLDGLFNPNAKPSAQPALSPPEEEQERRGSRRS